MRTNRYDSKKQGVPAYIEHLQSQGRYWFLAKGILDFQKVQLNPHYGEWVKRVVLPIRGYFYVIARPEHRVAGCLPAHWF